MGFQALTDLKQETGAHELIKDDRIVKPTEAAHILGMSKTSFWRLAGSDPNFPQKIYLTERRCGWKKTELLEYIDFKQREQRRSIH